MSPLQAVMVGFGGTVLDWLDWNEDTSRGWALSYDYLTSKLAGHSWPDCDAYVRAMLEAEQAHWHRVAQEQWSGPPSSLLSEGFRHLGLHIHETELLTALDGYARAVDGWAMVFPDTRETLQLLRECGYRIGLLSNTWWAAEWHNTDLAAHGLIDLLDEVAYTSDLPHSKPHPSVFLEVARRLKVWPRPWWTVAAPMIAATSGPLRQGFLPL